ncbi:hypothetical protein NT6N_17010 [Oceaniferula spumae]|uniref:FHA domain-containing protein n=1 Tax=Oceaniferula spumae TaxID=2979115 RepID=A0AAT9FL50_9BACT
MPRVTISEPGKTPQPYRFKLERKTINIGRGSDNDIIIECASVSTHHSVMERVEGGYILRDTGSTNGIKQDDTQMEVIDLYDGMEVLVGDIPLRFQLSKEEIGHLSEEDFTTHQKKKLPSIRDGEEAPARSAKPASTSSPRSAHRPQPQVAQSGGGFKTLLVFILMIVAVFAGMTLRHYKETKEFLPSKLMGGTENAKAHDHADDQEAAEEEEPAE